MYYSKENKWIFFYYVVEMNLLLYRLLVMKSKLNRVFLFISYNIESDINVVNVL